MIRSQNFGWSSRPHAKSGANSRRLGMTPSLPYIGTYKREIPVSVERLYDNTLDWEHLPNLHRSSFVRIECLRSDSSGFRAWVWPPRRSDAFLLELTLDRPLQRWISRTVQ